MSIPIRILHIEDNDDDATLIQREFERGGYKLLAYRCVENVEALHRALKEQEWDLVLCDYKLPGFDGLDALKIIKEFNLDIPFILISGMIGEETAVAAMKAGANDYLMKDNLARLTPAVERELRDAEARRQRRMAEAEAEAQRQFALQVMNTMGEGLTVADAEGKFKYINPAYAQMLGRAPGEIVGCHVRNFTLPDDHLVLEQAFKLHTQGKKATFEVELIHADGRLVPAMVTGVPIIQDGCVVEVISVVTNLTERKRAEVDLKAYATKLEQSNRDWQEFAYISSHDLQEPLRKVLTFSTRLAKMYSDVLDETGCDYLKRMREASSRMQTLVYDLLNYSRVSTRAQPFTKVDLNIIAKEIVSNLENLVRDTHGQVLIDHLPTTEADPTQMYQLLHNLIDNGLKFHKEGTFPIVEVSGNILGNECQMIVKDNGIGFDMQYLPRIFKPFQRLHGRGEYEGSGMGLAICRRIVERHNGEITATSTPGEGSTFIVTLPIEQPTEKVTIKYAKSFIHFDSC